MRDYQAISSERQSRPAPSQFVSCTAVNAAGIGAEAKATTAAGGRYADITALFCTADRCPVVIGNALVYRDDNHLTTDYAAALTPVIGALTDRALARTVTFGAPGFGRPANGYRYAERVSHGE